MGDTKLVTAAKPKIGGAVYTAPLGTALPMDSTSALNDAFKALGYISEDGLVNAKAITSENIKAWGGAIVNSVQTESSDTFKYTLIEGLNVEVLKEVYGVNNVSGNLESGIVVKSNATELPEHCIIVETVLKNAVKRIVIPIAKITEIGEVNYKDNENIGYAVTLQAFPDENSNTHYEYIKGKGE